MFFKFMIPIVTLQHSFVSKMLVSLLTLVHEYYITYMS